MNLLLKSLILAAIGCSMTQVSAMDVKPAGKKGGKKVNQIAKYLNDKYGCQEPAQQEQPEKPEKPVKKPSEKKSDEAKAR